MIWFRKMTNAGDHDLVAGATSLGNAARWIEQALTDIPGSWVGRRKEASTAITHLDDLAARMTGERWAFTGPVWLRQVRRVERDLVKLRRIAEDLEYRAEMYGEEITDE